MEIKQRAQSKRVRHDSTAQTETDQDILLVPSSHVDDHGQIVLSDALSPSKVRKRGRPLANENRETAVTRQDEDSSPLRITGSLATQGKRKRMLMFHDTTASESLEVAQNISRDLAIEVRKLEAIDARERDERSKEESKIRLAELRVDKEIELERDRALADEHRKTKEQQKRISDKKKRDGMLMICKPINCK